MRLRVGMMYKAKLGLGEKRAIHPYRRVNPWCRSGSGTIMEKRNANTASPTVLVAVMEELRFVGADTPTLKLVWFQIPGTTCSAVFLPFLPHPTRRVGAQ